MSNHLVEYNYPERLFYRWKAKYGGIYLAVFRLRALDAQDRLVIDEAAPWHKAVLREITLDEYKAFEELRTFDPVLAMTSLVNETILYCDLCEHPVKPTVLDFALVDYLFGVITRLSGFFSNDSVKVQQKARDSYTSLYKHLVIPLVTNIGMQYKDLCEMTDTGLAEQYLIYKKSGRDAASARQTGNPQIDKQLAQQALIDMSANRADQALQQQYIESRNKGKREEGINTEAENQYFRTHFGPYLSKQPPPDVSKMKRATLPAPSFLHKKK
jgi:hypothetical protein